jgi:hypothetical protein
MSISAMTKALEALESIKVTVSTSTEANVIDGIDLFPKQIAELRIGIAEAEQRSRMRNTTPVHASDISQECVDKTAKYKHEPVAWREVAGKFTHYYDYNEDGRGEPLYAVPQPDLARVGEVGVWGEWVGLTDEEIEDIYAQENHADVVLLTQAKLKEKNT